MLCSKTRELSHWDDIFLEADNSEIDLMTYFLLFNFQLGHIEGEPMRRGAFPITFVHFMADWQSKISEAAPEVDLLIT